MNQLKKQLEEISRNYSDEYDIYDSIKYDLKISDNSTARTLTDLLSYFLEGRSRGFRGF